MSTCRQWGGSCTGRASLRVFFNDPITKARTFLNQSDVSNIASQKGA